MKWKSAVTKSEVPPETTERLNEIFKKRQQVWIKDMEKILFAESAWSSLLKKNAELYPVPRWKRLIHRIITNPAYEAKRRLRAAWQALRGRDYDE